MKMILKLNTPGMTGLHKAGLAGLYLTLKTFEEKQESIHGLTWKLDKKQIILEWLENNIKDTFQNLINRSFRLDENGFIVLTGLELSQPLKIEQKYHLYLSLLNSFLQHGPSNPKEKVRSLSYEVDDHLCWIKDFAPIQKFRHQKATDDFISKEGQFNESVEASGWLYPGGGQRHVAYNNTKLNEPISLALPLLFAPVGVIYYKVNSKMKGRKARLVLLIPEITNLEEYSKIREIITTQNTIDLTASSSSDAVLRMLTTIATNKMNNQFAQFYKNSFTCRIITFGIVGWNEKQKSRTDARVIFSGNLPGRENYQKANAIFKNKWQKIPAKQDRKGNQTEPERYFVTSYSSRELIADNIAEGKDWYCNFNNYMSHKETREQLLYERKELYDMVETASYNNENEHLFIRVCHESWRRRLGKLGQRSRTENTSFQSLIRKESEKLRTSLTRCKNAETLRETVVDFWSRSGSNELLQGDGLTQLLPLFDEKNWKKARDLALLALVSYKPQNKKEEEALITNSQEEGEENND